MRIRVFLPTGALLSLVTVFAANTASAQSLTLFPANRATHVNPDTHLVLTFPAAPTIGASGQIRIYDAAGHKLVDTLDMSIPAGPDPSRRITAPPATPPAPPRQLDASIPTSPTTTTPAVRTIPADLHNYQLVTIGGLEDFHFYPIIVHGNVATIYPHNHALTYGHRYIVEIDAEVFPNSAFSGRKTWSFTTKPAAPAATSTRVTVSADGTGDFSTVQGAIDFVPDTPSHRVIIFVRNGNYEEIVFFRNKADITIEGEDRDKVQIGYGNNSGFNPPMPGPSRRCAFSAYNSTGIILRTFSVTNYFYGQAEGLLVSGSRNIVDRVNITGSGDALNLRGSVYLTDSRIIGDGDTILGVGPAFFNHCEIQSMGPFMWIRNTDANHGNVFLNCTFIARDRRAVTPQTPSVSSSALTSAQTAAPAAPPRSAAPQQANAARPMGAVFARLPMNHGLNYPYAEAVLINCKLKGIPAAGWGPIDADPAHLHLWEFNSTDLNGDPIDISQRHPDSKQLTQPVDAKTIADYSNPAFVLGGWNPDVRQ
ncbi:MAG TPA: pectinesterase family protein [Acidobacteriaceae bacterium]|nr:pectinesterase family protein [Acidobacteriaceae bacterium]